MKIVLITSCYNTLTRKILGSKDIDITGIAIAKSNSIRSFKSKIKQLLCDFFFRYLKRSRMFSPLPFFEFHKNEQEALCEWLTKINPDLIIVNTCPFLFDKEVIGVPKLGIVNIHKAMLPRFRGPSPLFWHYYDFDLSPGVSIHYIDEKEDTGDIILQESFNIEIGASYLKTLKNCQKLGYKLIVKAISAIKEGTVSKTPQSIKSSTKRAKRQSKEDIKELIKWDKWPVEHVFHFIKGTSRYDALPQHHTLNPKSRLVVESYSKNPSVVTHFKPGQMIDFGAGYYLACLDGFITIKKQKVSVVKSLMTYLWLVVCH